MKSNSALLGIIGGLAAGALLGVLYAPEKGTRTRKNIKKKSNKIKTDLHNELEGMLQKVSDKYDDLKDRSEELVQQGKEELINAGKQQLNKIKQN